MGAACGQQGADITAGGQATWGRSARAGVSVLFLRAVGGHWRVFGEDPSCLVEARWKVFWSGAWKSAG